MRAQILILVAMLVPACGGESQPDVAVTSQQSACKQNSSTTFTAGKVTVTVAGDTVTVLHADAYYNCASRVKLDASVVNGEILVQEVITNPDELARCMCNYDLQAQLLGLAAGSYAVKVHDVEGKLVGSTQILVGGPALAVGQTMQSGCKPGTDATFTGSTITVDVQGSDATILHENAEYNCAAKLKLMATLSGSQILVQETVTNPEEAADCMCPFDLQLVVGGLAAGSYMVKVVGDGGAVVDTLPITVP